MATKKHWVKIELAENGSVVTHANSSYDYDKEKTIHHPIEDTLFDVLGRMSEEGEILERCQSLGMFFLNKAQELTRAAKEKGSEKTEKSEATEKSDDIPFN